MKNEEEKLLTDEEIDYFISGPSNNCGPMAKKYWSDNTGPGKPFSKFNKEEYERICKEENISYGDWMEYAKGLVSK